MKRIIKPGWLPIITLSAGLVGLILQLWLRKAGTDEAGLLEIGHPARYLLPVLTALFGAAGVLAVLPIKKGSYTKRFPRSIPSAAGNFAAAAGVIVFGVTQLLGTSGRFVVLLCVLSIPTAVSFVLAGYCRIREKSPSFLLHGIMALYFMVLLLIQYPVWSVTPQFLLYCFEAFACISLMLTAYYRSALDLRQQTWKMYAFLNQCAAFFCCLSLTGSQWWFYLSMLLWTMTDYPVFFRRVQPARKQDQMFLPEPVRYCIRTLEQAGYEAYAVGGCVRDSLLGLTPHDYDLCTSATPEQICATFAGQHLLHNGEKHGTIGIVLEGNVYEITTFRAEGAYSDNRHPDWVVFVTNLEQDLQRRDFTVNAMAYSPAKGYIDPWGGRQDLQQGILRAVGDPEVRFREDALRILRGIRFAVRFRFTPDPQTEAAMEKLAPLMDNLARERVFDELCKLLPLATAEDLLHWAPILTQVIPELAACRDFDQHSPHHRYDVYTHTAHAVASVSQDLGMRWAALLHDIAKPTVFHMDEEGRGHFHNHASAGAEMAEEILRRLKAPNVLREQVVFLIAQHMTPLEPDRKLLLRRLGQYGKDTVLQLLELQKADFHSKGTEEDSTYFTQIEALLDQLSQEAACVSAKDLAINGRDILALGVEPGPRVGDCMRTLLAQVQDGSIDNTRDALLEAAQAFLDSPETQEENS